MTPWITSDSASLESNAPVAIVNASFSYIFPPLSVATFVGQSRNQPPILLPVLDQTVDPGFTVIVTNQAIEPNVPPLDLSFSLLSAPSNATLTPLSLSNQLISLVITGATGPDYVLFASTNLVDWEPILSAPAPSLPLTLTATNSSAWPARFYKVLLSP